MATNIFSQDLNIAAVQFKQAAADKASKTVLVNGDPIAVPYPFPSPVDWRDNWIYFILADRFNNPLQPPNGEWDKRYGFRQGGTINGITAQLDYIAGLGAGAIWLSPLIKNAAPANWEYNYHGYAAQDFLTIDARFGSDGTSATAEQELIQLVEQAHARGMFVIMDIVLNHTARVFDYEYGPPPAVSDFTNEAIINGRQPVPTIDWINGLGFARTDWKDNLPSPAALSDDDAIWPSDLQRADFFRRSGSKLSDRADPFVKGDFGQMRQLVVEYLANNDNQKELRDKYGQTPVLNILIQIYRYLIAKFDLDGFRIDTVKYVQPQMVETFCNAMREFALSTGKHNFFTFGEVYDQETTLRQFIGRNTTDGFGMDAALDFPLFYKLPGVAKATIPVETLQQVFTERKKTEEDLLSSHGEAGKYFVSFLDNHDQNERFNHRGTPAQQVKAGLAILFCLQGIPCLYYGTEQGLQATVDQSDTQSSFEFVREALWGKPDAFDIQNEFYLDIQQLSRLRYSEPSLLYGRLYFREVSDNKTDYGLSSGKGGIVAFSRMLANREVLVVANTNTTNPFHGFVVMDLDTNRGKPVMKCAYSNVGTEGQGRVEIIKQVNFYKDGKQQQGDAAVIYVELAVMEVQILIPA